MCCFQKLLACTKYKESYCSHPGRLCPCHTALKFMFKFFKSSYLDNHSSESIHIWPIRTLDGWLSFHESRPMDPCPRVGLEVKIEHTFKKCFSTFLLRKQLRQIVGQTLVSLVSLTCGSWSEGQHDLYFNCPVILPYILKTIWCMNIILWDYDSVWPDIWPQNKCRSLWPIFHGPVILPYTCIFKTVWCMNIILRDYESVWPGVCPQNKCRSLWAVFHGPVILPYILESIWFIHTSGLWVSKTRHFTSK